MNNKTFFLDKIFNTDLYDFYKLIGEIVADLEYNNFSFSVFKKNDKYIVDLENETDYASIFLEDYSLIIRTSKSKSVLNYSNYLKTKMSMFLKGYYRKKYKETINQMNIEL